MRASARLRYHYVTGLAIWRPIPMEEINIEYGMPTVQVAMPLLTERLRSMKKSGVKAVKIIHGYGSTGKGGRLRKATLKLLDESKQSGLIKEFVIGEQWSKFELRTLTLIDRIPQLYKDQDLERHNRGITVVFL
jgi:hypothetical protein